MQSDEIKYHFNQLPDNDKREFVSDVCKEMAVKIVNLIQEDHMRFGLVFCLIGATAGGDKAFRFWKEYWEQTDTPEYAHGTWFGFFMAETTHRADTQEQFKKELEAL